MSLTAPPPGTAPLPAASVNEENPWPGLEAYRESDHPYFRGRQDESEELRRLVMRARLTVLFGLSGLGKSSLIQAGLFPLLGPDGVFPVYVRLDFSAPEPDLIGQVRTALTQQAAAARIETPDFEPSETLWELFHRRDRDFWNARNRPVRPLLVFDQFEEAFTLGQVDVARRTAADRFLTQLADLVEGRPPAHLKDYLDGHPDAAKTFAFSQHTYKILLALREDFLPDLETLRPRMPSVALNRFRLRRMTGHAALLVVNQAPHLVDPDVAEDIVRFVAADQARLPLAELEVEPALLSVVCRELNIKRRADRLAKITPDLLKGTRDQVLAEVYERSVKDLAPDVRRFVEDHLLTKSGFRDSIAEDNALAEPGVTQLAIDTLVNRRLIRRDMRSGILRIELTHDRLCGVIRTSRDRRVQEETQEAQRQALLADQERERQALLEAQEADRRLRDRRELKRSRIALTMIGFLLLATIGALWSANAQRKVAEQRKDDAQRAAATAREAQQEAEAQRRRAEDAVELIKHGLIIRQAALSGREQDLQQLLKSLDRNAKIRFRAHEKDLKYKNAAGDPVYQFSLYPDANTLPTGEDGVAFVTYLANHPTFQNTLMIAGAMRDFRVTWIGWGCLTRIVALVEYQDPKKTPTVTEFDMCRDLGWP